ncbi:MAG: isoamylase early set domain-containing protein, partial [Gemmatimonadaceae bacterium]
PQRMAQSNVRFTLVAPTASHVSIVGDFNGWNPSSLPLRRSADGRTWEVEVPLPPGRYAYSFVVDGALARDPSAPQALDADLGTTNSVVMVRGS